jgi:hypothetical protein
VQSLYDTWPSCRERVDRARGFNRMFQAFAWRPAAVSAAWTLTTYLVVAVPQSKLPSRAN